VRKTIEWNGQRIEALQSQFLAFLKGRITESAIGLYAQADDGSVWYFGEDVVDYEKGHAATTDGTWVVGVNGPGAMIMLATPWSATSTGRRTFPARAPTARASHQDETRLEPKTFAP
jgi:hypothetical protein